ncbi:MAG: SpoIIE family protein phosphatase [Thermoanaerobaculaceae bacterium]|nr:SpoIIE family protein phosphatase [Thermoanaerobaculaceae bacterium]
MKRWFLPRDVQALLDAVALAAGGVVLLDPDGKLVGQAGDVAAANRALPVRCGEARATLLLPPPAGEGLGVVAAAALERMAAARLAIDDLASATRTLWWQQNLVFSSGGLLRHGFGDRDINRWLLDRLAGLQLQTVVVCMWDGAILEVAGGVLPAGLRAGDDVPASALAAQVLAAGEPIAFVVQDGSGAPELGIAVEPGQPCLMVPLRSADSVLGLVMLARRRGEGAFGAGEVKLVQLLADLLSVGIVNRSLVGEAEHTARLLREIELAAEIQRRLFPPQVARSGGLEIAAHCRPVTQVGGDGFLQRRLAGGTLLLGVVDLTGHGIAVALALAALYARLDALADAVETPARLLQLVNDQLTQGEFNWYTMATAVIAFADPDSGRFTVATAAHPRAFVRRAGGRIDVLEASGLPLGVRAGEQYPLQEGRLEAGDLLVLHSDGISEATGHGSDLFGVDGLHRALEPGFASASAALAAVLDSVAAFTGGAPAIDDQTIMIVRKAEAAGE